MELETLNKYESTTNEQTEMAKDEYPNTNNRCFLSGIITGEPAFSHEVFGEGFYEMNLSIPRLSGAADIIPMTLSERLLTDAKVFVGKQISVKGQFRSYNKLIGERSKLMLTVFAREITDTSDSVNPNIIELTGFICKPPIYRTTPFNREICDILVAVNRAYNKSDYIPAIAWGRNARFAKNMLVGEKVHISGRIQSREYQKRLDDNTVETRTAFEVSINKISRDALESQFSDTDTAFLGEE
jgi:primosomal replication protein N